MSAFELERVFSAEGFAHLPTPPTQLTEGPFYAAVRCLF